MAVLAVIWLGLGVVEASISPGDIVLLQINDSGTATGCLVKWAPLVDLPGGTAVSFTDRSWVTGSTLFAVLQSEGEVTFTAPSNIVAGTIFTFKLDAPGSGSGIVLNRDSDNAAFNSSIVVNGWTNSFTLTSVGDNFFVYTGTNTAPNFIFGTLFTTVTVNRDPITGWSTGTTASTTSMLPSTLTNGVDAMALNYTPAAAHYMAYTGSTNIATKAAWLARIVNTANWTPSTAAVTGSFVNILSISSGTSVAPVFIGTNTSLFIGENAGATDITGLLHVSDTDSGQTETWTQSAAPGHGTLAFSDATAASGSANIAPGGTITYTPTAGYFVTDSFAVQVSDGTGGTAVRTINVTMNLPPGITSTTTVNATYGNTFTYTITASNSPTSFGASGLPAGLTLTAATGVITGKPTQSGTYTATISATNATSYGTAVLTITVATVNLTVSGVVANNKTYDGTTNTTLNLTGATLNGIVNSDSITLNAAGVTAAFADANAGNNKSVTITGLGLSGVEATNYTLTQPSITANITPATAMVILNRSVQLYNAAAKPVTVSTTPVGLPVSLTYNGSTTAPSAIGAYTVIGTITNPNYAGSATNYLYVATAPQFTSVYTNGNNIVFAWSAMPQVDYQVITTPALLPVFWVNFNSQVTATNATMTTTDVIDRNQTARFYRVQLILQ